MCRSLGLKATGTKKKLVKRVARHFLGSTSSQQTLQDKIESAIGPTSPEGLPAEVRRFYTDNYSALDQFDRLWYEMKFIDHARDWESYFAWSFIHCAFINARAVYCTSQNRRVPLKEFLEQFVNDLNDKF